MTEDKKHTVYIHIVPRTISKYDHDKYYVGITKHKPENRWNSGKGYKSNAYFTNAINKYGWDNIEHQIIANNLTKEEATNFEIKLISLLQSNNLQYGYNLNSGGGGGNGIILTEEAREKRAKNLSKMWENPEYRAKQVERIGEDAKKRWQNPEYRAKMQEVNNFNKILRGADNPNSKKVIILNTKQVFANARETSEHFNGAIKRTTINQYCNPSNRFISTIKDKNGDNLVFMYYEDYLKLSPEEVKNKIEYATKNSKKRIPKKKYICLNTGEIFTCQNKDILEKYNTTPNNVYASASSKNYVAGVLDSGERLIWRYYDDYINMTDEEINKAINDGQRVSGKRRVVDLETNNVYQSMSDCSSHLNIPYHLIYSGLHDQKHYYHKRFRDYDNYLDQIGITQIEALSMFHFIKI